MEKETLEAAAEEYFLQEYSWNGKDSLPYKDEDVKLTKENFIAGAKWQAERMYSEEEVYKILLNYQSNYPYASNEIGLKKWFEQFEKVGISKYFCECGSQKDQDCKYCTSCNSFNSI